MSDALQIAQTGLEAQQTKMATIANNLANASTAGFKRGRVVFEDLLYQTMTQVGAQSSEDTELPSGLMMGTGVRVVATEKLFTQGTIEQTENALDVAIEGRGFIQVLLPDGTMSFTRDGAMQVDSQGQLVTSNGYVVQPAINIPQDALSINIGSDGIISAVTPGNTTPSQLGQLQLADFINPTGLQPIGKNLFLESASSGNPQVGNPGLNGIGTVLQGFVESSNVNVVEELVGMIETQRAYEMNSKAISTTDQMLQYVSNNL